MTGEVTAFMWVCIILGLVGPTLFFLFLDWLGLQRLRRRVRREEAERNSANF